MKMKKGILATLVILGMAICISCAVGSHTQKTANATLYFNIDDMPDAGIFLPPPPDTTSTQFVHDIAQYMWGKSVRSTERGQTAIDEAVTDIDQMLELFSGAFGMKITAQETPDIYKVIQNGVLTIRLGATKPKAKYMRKRPYSRFNEPTLIPEDEEELKNNGSYPSGHTVRGWGMALLLSEINPEAQDSLFALGYEWGQSRVIAGFHWQSDVDAAFLLASACYARLHSSEAFLKQMRKARDEFRKKKRQQ